MEEKWYKISKTELSVRTKEEDRVRCWLCGKGIMIPLNPDSPQNYCFQCSYCGEHANIDPLVIVE